MRTIYDKAIRSPDFIRVFAEANASLMDATGADGSRWLDVEPDLVTEVLRLCSVYSVANLRRFWDASDGASIDETYPQKVACKPPGKATWIEAPSFDPSVDVHPFFYVYESSGTPQDCASVAIILNFMMAGGQYFREGMSVMRLDEHGCTTHPMTMRNGPDVKRESRMTLMATYFLAFLNCRNINIVEHNPSRQARRAAERSNEPPPITYRTVEITGSGTTEINRPKGTPTDTMPRHLCRGHFKRYTADRPLLGRHVGQYWWDQHARGNAERGVVFKDYEVTA